MNTIPSIRDRLAEKVGHPVENLEFLSGIDTLDCMDVGDGKFFDFEYKPYVVSWVMSHMMKPLDNDYREFLTRVVGSLDFELSVRLCEEFALSRGHRIEQYKLRVRETGEEYTIYLIDHDPKHAKVVTP